MSGKDHWRPRARGFVAAAALVVALVAVPAASASPSPKFDPPKKDYLAIGDSLTFGFQAAKVIAGLPNPDPASFNTGLVDDFAALMSPIDPGLQVENLGCPGATTDTVLASNGCTTYPFALHVSYTTTQMQAALDFLQANRGRVSPITVGIGANDVLGFARSCNQSPTCIVAGFPGLVAHITTNLQTILSALRQAAPDAEIIVFGIYNPNVTALALDPLVRQLNSAEATVAAANRARFADIFPAINLALPNELASVCTFTAVCGPLQDIHPTDAGYANIANAIFAASGYAKLGGGDGGGD